MKYIILSIALITTLTACVSTQNTKPRPFFNYIIEGGVEWGVVQAFTMGSEAHIQFLNIDRVNPVFISSTGRKLTYKVTGMYAILENAPSHFFVVSSFGRAHVIQKELKETLSRLQLKPFFDKTVENIKANPLLKIKPKTLQEIPKKKSKNPITQALDLEKQQLAILEELNPNGVYLPANSKGNDQIKIRVYFDDFSTNFIASPMEREIILALARTANKIYIRGFTDSFSSTVTAVKLAKYRSVNTMEYLRANGISKPRIRAFYKSSNSFLVANEGENKRYNRRAELLFFF